MEIFSEAESVHIRWDDTSYVMAVVGGRYLVQAYWGSRLESADVSQMIQAVPVAYLPAEPIDAQEFERYHRNWKSAPDSLSDRAQMPFSPGFSPEFLSLEYPGFGTGTMGVPALTIRGADGTTATRLEYKSHRVEDGGRAADRGGSRPADRGPEGLPWVGDLTAPAKTVVVELLDAHTGVEAHLHYTPVPGTAVLLRWARIMNGGTAPVHLEGVASASVDLPRADLDMVTLNGSWAREHQLHRRAAAPGVQHVDSTGGSSSHQHAPFVALTEPGTGEESGRVWALSLMYSGNHRHLVEVSQHGRVRIQSGINPVGFRARLEPGESFDTPAAALTYSERGLGGMSDNFHRFVRSALLPSRWRDRDRPIILNTWEAYYSNVNRKKVADLARRGAAIGAEILVLDDGWFVGRHDDTRALGDWTVDPEKFPGGLGPVVEDVRSVGLEFGLWIEPEMVSPESDLFRAHPQWVLQVPDRTPTLSRNQLVLDLSNPEVVDYLLAVFTGILESADIRYIKWDMNRPMSEPGSFVASDQEQGSVMHRYILGVYRLLDGLTSRFPDVLFEGCAGGGGRFDLGMLAYTPQYWASDQTDAVVRQQIQYGSSLLFPPEIIGAHVSAVPNHQVGRVTPAATRGLTALAFNFGYELDLAHESAEDIAAYARISQLYRENRSFFRTGTFVRLIPSDGAAGSRRGGGFAEGGVFGGVSNPVSGTGRFAWAVVAPDRSRAMVFFFQALAGANTDGGFLSIRGLEDGATYRDTERDVLFDAVFLRERGLWLPPAIGDFRSAYWILEKQTTR